MLPVAGAQLRERLVRVAGPEQHRLGGVVEDAPVGGQVPQAHHRA